MRRPKIIPRRMKPTRGQKLIQFITLVPLSILALERLWVPFHGTISEYLNVESIGVTKTIKSVPTTPLKSSIPPPYPLERVTMSYRIVDSTCPRGTTRVTNVVNGRDEMLVHHSSTRRTKIPKIFHQQAKTRCVTPAFYQLHERWHQVLLLEGNTEQQQQHQHGDNDTDAGGWSIYFHNDEAMTRLLAMEEFVQEFPHLRLILRNCVQDRKTKSILWRYLVLYIYGGIYADLDTAPDGFNGGTVRDSDDAIFLHDEASGQLSIGFMAASPRHPMLYYALQHALRSLMATDDISMGSEIVSLALDRAFVAFQNDNDFNSVVPIQNSDVKNYQQYIGTDNRTVTVITTDSNNPKSGMRYVTTNALDPAKTKTDYKKMGMTDSTSKRQIQNGPQSCRMKILMDISSISSTA